MHGANAWFCCSKIEQTLFNVGWNIAVWQRKKLMSVWVFQGAWILVYISSNWFDVLNNILFNKNIAVTVSWEAVFFVRQNGLSTAWTRHKFCWFLRDRQFGQAQCTDPVPTRLEEGVRLNIQSFLTHGTFIVM